MESLCSKFGIVEEFASFGPTISSLSGTPVKVSNCDVKFIPHLVPLVVLGSIVYPIKFFLDISVLGFLLNLHPVNRVTMIRL